MRKLQPLKIALLIVILAEEIKRAKKIHLLDLLEISSCLITDYNNNDTSKLLEYSARLNSHVNNHS
ncbi:hypothetical protein [Macrococcoides caseolyticum]|uniref:hypothetical protein n=1 Tax=Macrococcoides caseolyticum TaxID=69966 RepID=UPI0010616903|nr:hypothetical protein [Macrococcus caseolyticus]TDM18897.1 hypothetical protein ETI00_02750 [Macrococcus caseolyticus]